MCWYWYCDTPWAYLAALYSTNPPYLYGKPFHRKKLMRQDICIFGVALLGTARFSKAMRRNWEEDLVEGARLATQ